METQKVYVLLSQDMPGNYVAVVGVYNSKPKVPPDIHLDCGYCRREYWVVEEFVI